MLIREGFVEDMAAPGENNRNVECRWTIKEEPRFDAGAAGRVYENASRFRCQGIYGDRALQHVWGLDNRDRAPPFALKDFTCQQCGASAAQVDHRRVF